MIEWLKGEVGGLLIAALGYVLREFGENNLTPERILDSKGLRFTIRLLSALGAGILVQAALPAESPDYVRVLALAFVGAATPEIVTLLITRGLSRLDKATKDDR